MQHKDRDKGLKRLGASQGVGGLVLLREATCSGFWDGLGESIFLLGQQKQQEEAQKENWHSVLQFFVVFSVGFSCLLVALFRLLGGRSGSSLSCLSDCWL